MSNNKIKYEIFLAVLLIIASVFPANSQDIIEKITGKPQIIEGDLIEIDDQRIRLYGIDAPEMDQTCTSRKGLKYDCGDHSKRYLASLITRFAVKCEVKRHDQQKIPIAVCYLGFLDINESMVFDGWALAYTKDGDEYVRAEKASKARNSGLWKGTFIAPWEWRQGKR